MCVEWYGDHRDLHSFPTRRSSDLGSSHAWDPRSKSCSSTTTPPSGRCCVRRSSSWSSTSRRRTVRSEEHTSELQSRQYLVCRLLLEKKTRSTASTRFCSCAAPRT